MSYYTILSQILAACFAVCIFVGNAQTPDNLYTDEIIDIQLAPHQVALFSRGDHFGSGSIISANYILTSASCVTMDIGVYRANIKVLSGVSDLFNRTNSQFHEVIQLIIHEDFDPGNFWANDIAVLKLENPIVFSFTRSFIALARVSLRARLSITTTSWRGKDRTKKLLRRLRLKILHINTCKELYSSYGSINDNQHCIGSDRLSSWIHQGDAGNAVMRYGALVGIISFGVMNRPDLAAVFIAIDDYKEWIESIIGQ